MLQQLVIIQLEDIPTLIVIQERIHTNVKCKNAKMSVRIKDFEISSIYPKESPCNDMSVCVLQLQKSKEREEQLEDVIQAYEKIHMEKSSLQRDLDKMVRTLLKHSFHHIHAKFGCWADGQLR